MSSSLIFEALYFSQLSESVTVVVDRVSTDDECPEGARLVGTLPDDAQHKHNADWWREERSHSLYVVEELRAALHHRNPHNAHTHHH